MDFEPPSFSLGLDDFEDFSAPSPPLPPAEVSVELEPAVCAHDVPERRFKRLRRVVEAKDDGFKDPSPEDDIEDFSEEEARTGSGIVLKAGYSRLPYVRKTPRTGSSKAAKLSCKEAAPSSWQFRTDRDAGSLGLRQTDQTVGHLHVDTGWRMRQPNFDEADAFPRGVNAVGVSTDNAGLGPEHSSDWYRGLISSSPTIPDTRPSGQGWRMNDVIDLEDEWDDEDRHSYSDVENIDPTGRGQDSNGQDIYTECQAAGRGQDSNGQDIYPMCQGDKQRVELLRNRFPNFIPVDALSVGEGFDGEPVYIDYRNQFRSSPTSCGLQGSIHQSHKGGRTQETHNDRQTDQRFCGKKAKGRAPVRNKRAHVTPERQTAAAGGFWTTEKTGKRIYVTLDGRKLAGQIAYRQHLKENPKRAKAAKQKASRASKKQK